MITTILEDKFEGAFLNIKGYEGSSYKVKVKVNEILTEEKIKKVYKVIDYFDHTLTVGEESLKKAETHSLRIVLINKEMREFLFSQILFNLVFEIVGSSLKRVEVFDTVKTGFVCDNFDESLNVSFDYLKGK